MKAIILAGGLGKRLKPITDYIPKPLVPIKNIPIIEWQINYLKKFGVDEIVICTGYKTEMIENYLKIKNMNVKIKLSIEKSALGTGGAIKKAGRNIDDDYFFVINGDIISNIDLIELSKKPNSIASIELRTKFGVLEINHDQIINFKEKQKIPDLWMNAGIYYLEKKIIKDLPVKGDIEKTLFPKYAKNNSLFTVKFKNTLWYSIDSFKDIEECSADIDEIMK